MILFMSIYQWESPFPNHQNPADVPDTGFIRQDVNKTSFTRIKYRVNTLFAGL